LSTAQVRDDRVLRGTRWLAIFIIPFLVVASIMLFFWPQDTGRLFAWPIKPSMTAMMLAAAYMGGIYFFSAVVLASRWHTIKTGFLPVLAFASLLGIATLLHWDRFTHGHVSFYAWAGLYFIAPFLVLAAWLLNRRTDPNLLVAGDVEIPRVLRWLVGVVGVITVVIAFLLFVQPGLMLAVWPWTLTPLTARVAGAMFALPGIVGLSIAADRRWSAARIILQAQAFSILVILIAAARAWGDYDKSNPAAYLFAGGLAGLLVAIAALYIFMEARLKEGMHGAFNLNSG
jgi:hypothetical protein